MLKKIISIVALTCVALLPLASQAEDLNAAFNGLTGSDTMTSTEAAGIYKNASRTVFSGGSADLRVPRSTVNLISITPPSLSMGCSGISAHFGGFSYISGKEIEQMIQNIAQGAPGMVMQLAIKTLCPQCEAVIQAMESLAQRAAKFAIDSCHVSNQLESWAEKAVAPQKKDTETTICGQSVVIHGDAKDSLSTAVDSACSSVQGAIATMESYIPKDNPNNPAAQQAAKDQLAAKGYVGNLTWKALTAMGYTSTDTKSDELHRKILLMNLFGTQIITNKSPVVTNLPPSQITPLTQQTPTPGQQLQNCATANGPANGGTANNCTGNTLTQTSAPGTNNPDPKFITPPHINTQFLYDLFLCGTPQPGFDPSKPTTFDFKTTRAVRLVCDRFWSYKWFSQPIYDCADNYTDCEQLKEVLIKDAKAVQGPGFLYQVSTLLQYGVNQVREGQAFKWNDTQMKQLVALINAAPYPLYQAINAAAVYPAAAGDLVDSLSVITSELLVYNLINDMVSQVGLPVASSQSANQAQLDRLYTAMGQIRADNIEHRKEMAQEVALQEGIAREIYQINQAIQRQVMTDDFLGSQRFTTAVLKSTQSATGGSH